MYWSERRLSMVMREALSKMTALKVKLPQYQYISAIFEYQLESAVAVTPGPSSWMPYIMLLM